MRKIAISLILMIFALVSAFAVEDNLAVKLTVADQTAVSFTKNIFSNVLSSSLDHTGFDGENGSHYVSISPTGDYETEEFYASAKTNKADSLEMYVTYTDLSDSKGHTIEIEVASDKCYVNGTEKTNSSSVVDGEENTIKLTEPESNVSGMRAVSHALVVSVADKEKYEAATEGNYTATLTLKTQLAEE